MTAIEWTDETWNPVRGCRRVSPGCENCYAERQAIRQSGEGKPYHGLVRSGPNGPRWTGIARFAHDVLEAPLHWRAPRRVFVNSMSDLFHEDLADEQIAAVFGVMAACPQHTFQILTKRPERALRWFTEYERNASALPSAVALALRAAKAFVTSRLSTELYSALSRAEKSSPDTPAWPLQNVWLGASCEDQPRAIKRASLLRRCPAAVHFLSVEPLLEQVALDPRWFEWTPIGPDADGESHLLPPIRWVIVGGESGPGARPCDVRWIESIVQQCAIAGAACFVKQLGACYFDERNGVAGASCVPDPQLVQIARKLTHRKGGDPNEWPEHLRVRQWPEVRP